jgi:hypothetical protein
VEAYLDIIGIGELLPAQFVLAGRVVVDHVIDLIVCRAQINVSIEETKMMSATLSPPIRIVLARRGT